MDGQGIEVRTAGIGDIPLLTALRLEFSRDIRPERGDDVDGRVKAATLEYMEGGMAEGTFLGYLAQRDRETAGACGLLIYDLPPLIGRLRRRQGHLLSFYVRPAHRRRGVGRALMVHVIRDARERGNDRL